VILGTPVTGDNCSVASVSNDAPSAFPIGETVVTWTVTDASGNTETATQVVTVEDKEAPIVLTQNLLFEILEGETVTVVPEDVDAGSYDNCNSVSLSIDQNVFTDVNEGENIVTLIGTDDAGNISSAQATITIVVIRDPACKVFAFANELTVSLDNNGSATISTIQVDNGSYSECANGKLDLTLSKSIFNCTDLGENLVTMTATDRDGNIGTVEFNVTVVDDIPPGIDRTPKSIKTTLIDGEFISLPDYRETYSVSDNCVVSSYEQLPASGTLIDQVGSYTITLIATDSYGNSSQSQFELIVEAAGNKGGGKGGGKGKNKSIETNGLTIVPWNTPFEQIKDYELLIMDENGQEVNLKVNWSEEGYEPLVSGIYTITGSLLESISLKLEHKVQMYVLVEEKPHPIAIEIDSNIIPKSIVEGEVIGRLITVDPTDNIHTYNILENEFADLDGDLLVWKGAQFLKNEMKLIVSSTDRVGQSIEGEIALKREMIPNQVMVYPNPASTETNIRVDIFKPSKVAIRLYDAKGVLVVEIEEEHSETFIKNLNLNAIANGMYQIHVQIDHQIITKILVKNN
jgi:hypothetical protein